MPRKNELDRILEDAPVAMDSAPEVNLTGDIARKANAELTKAQAKVQENMRDLKKSALVEVSMAPMYRPYFGNIMTVTLNNLSIYLPLDGRGYKIPRPYAAIVHARRRAVDDHVMRMERMADVQKNFDGKDAGSLELIPR